MKSYFVCFLEPTSSNTDLLSDLGGFNATPVDVSKINLNPLDSYCNLPGIKLFF